MLPKYRRSHLRKSRRALLLPLLAILVNAQGPSFEGPPPGRGRPPSEQEHFRSGPPGKWWNNPQIIRRLSLTSDQQRAIEEVFQKNRLKLIDLAGSLEKEEAILDPLLSAEHPQSAKIFAQIDRVADARAALEKANARMLFGFRTCLTAEQWNTFQSRSFDAPPFRDHARPPGPGR